MSFDVAAGSSRSRFQSVSVVPIIQCRFHGITNSTLFSVRSRRPIVDLNAERGTTMCTPFDARTFTCPVSPTIFCVSPVHTPVAFRTVRARMSNSSPVSRSRQRAPTTRSPFFKNSTTDVRFTACAPAATAVRKSVIAYRASSTCPSKYESPPMIFVVSILGLASLT